MPAFCAEIHQTDDIHRLRPIPAKVVAFARVRKPFGGIAQAHLGILFRIISSYMGGINVAFPNRKYQLLEARRWSVEVKRKVRLIGDRIP